MRPRPIECGACLKPILFAILGKKLVAVEACRPGKGDIALTSDMFTGGETRYSAPTADVVNIGTSHRLHAERCRGLKSFTAGGQRKVRP